MNIIELIAENKLVEAKEKILNRLHEIAQNRILEAKEYIATEDMLDLDESNIIRLGRVYKIRRRVRRDSSGRITIQTNRMRSAMSGYSIRGTSVRRISAVQRIRRSQQLKRAWKTSRRAKLSRSLLKRKMSMRRRYSLGLR